ncbi:NADH:flavin oxidoreductase/NADH oxidase-like protein [Sarocladium strictum]
MASLGSPIATAPLRLPCGLVLKNRLVKTAMSEKMAIGTLPTTGHLRVYQRWAEGGWAALITGNIMVDEKYLGAPGDVAVPKDVAAALELWTAWAQVARAHDCHMIAQLNHPGRQSPLGAGKKSFFTKNIAPSAIPLNLGDNLIARCASAIVFGTPRAMTQRDIDEVIVAFVAGATLAVRAGFQGVEVHAGHGFLLSQFLTSSTNKRQDEYGGSAEKRAEILLHIIRAIRDEVPATFCVGVKINTADFGRNPEEYGDLIRQIELMKKEKIDYINLSGGSFEDPTSNSPSTASRSESRDAFFLQASRDIKTKFPDLTLILTGGFRSRAAIHSALESGACSMVGIGRPAIKYPDLPRMALSQQGTAEARFDVEAAPSPGWIGTKIRSVGAGAETKYWGSMLQRL